VFSTFLSALSGSMEGADEHSAFPPRARAHYTPLFLGARSATAIEDSLSHLLGQKVRLLEFQPRWRELEHEDRSRLGKAYATLGGDMVLGNRVRSASDAFRVVIRAGTMRDYKSLLPSGERFAIAAAALDAFKPSHLEWDICLEIDESVIAPAKLDGRSQLGWTGWVGKRTPAKRGQWGTIRADAHLRKISKPRKRMSQ
jgi:type VI secretion system protein ImpH